jgi:AcrR family transcriptional regulator
MRRRESLDSVAVLSSFSMSETPWGDAKTLRTRRLPPGRGSSREAAAVNQRERLYAALVALADERGYGVIRVADLIEVAGVSRGAFYEHFDGKEDLLVAVVQALAEASVKAITEAIAGDGKLEERVRAAVDLSFEAAVAQPAAARLCLIGAYGGGAAAADSIQRGIGGIVLALEQALGCSDDHAALPADAVRGIVGGLRRIVTLRLRAQTEGELRELALGLTEWILGYRTPAPPIRAPRAAGGTRPSYAPRDQAEQVLLGVCAAVAGKGYVATTISDIARHASTSTRAFYAHFDSKEQAYLAAIDLVNHQATATAVAAARRAPDWPASVRGAIHALCGFYADEPAMARAAVVEVYGAGERALVHRDEAIDSLTELLARAADDVPNGAVFKEAIGGALDGLLFDAIRSGDARKVRAIAPSATFLALAPFLGSPEAASVAGEPGRSRR